MTITLLTDSQGKKMGKTAGNAVWLDPNKTSPYDFFQYWRNVDDADVIKCMNMLTFMPLEEIAEYAKLTGSDLNRAKEKLAYELTELVHGKEEAEKALDGVHLKIPVEETDEVCERCGRKMVIKMGRFGRFLACPGYPECSFTKPLVIEMPGKCPRSTCLFCRNSHPRAAKQDA